MTWHDLLFLHWPASPDLIRAAFCAITGREMPHEMEVDTFDGQAWFAVVPFWMSGVRHRRLPALPGLSRFPELNVRTYVRVRGSPASISSRSMRSTRADCFAGSVISMPPRNCAAV